MGDVIRLAERRAGAPAREHPGARAARAEFFFDLAVRSRTSPPSGSSARSTT